MAAEDVLVRCLRELESGNVSVDDVVSHFPQARAELLELVRLSQELETLPRDICLSSAAKSRIRNRVMAGIEEARQASPSWQERLRRGLSAALDPVRLGPAQLGAGLARPASAAIAVALAGILVGNSTVSAAMVSLPGDGLYPMKTALEHARLALAMSDEDKVQTYLWMASSRVEEVARASETGRLDALPGVVEAYEASVGQALSLASATKEEQKVQLQAAAVQNSLQQVYQKASEPAQTIMAQALSISTTAVATTAIASPPAQSSSSSGGSATTPAVDTAPAPSPTAVIVDALVDIGAAITDLAPTSGPAVPDKTGSPAGPSSSKDGPLSGPIVTLPDPIDAAPIKGSGAIGSAPGPVPSTEGSGSIEEPAKAASPGPTEPAAPTTDTGLPNKQATPEPLPPKEATPAIVSDGKTPIVGQGLPVAAELREVLPGAAAASSGPVGVPPSPNIFLPAPVGAGVPAVTAPSDPREPAVQPLSGGLHGVIMEVLLPDAGKFPAVSSSEQEIS